ncbi:hypothetical protein EVG20_g7437 [Dentipellis fragilis]|uniref:Amidohydrolase-related domain-containing protein n=1 Tax=Dentipellis fragilis TaxID=205917 RepID=A0A4Y9YEX0_9AGAM|nr:hypothetical protein EVG20_g7437 [Dentipellis fragilis]
MSDDNTLTVAVEDYPIAPPLSPGVGARRKGPKTLPRLPLSAFSPPNSGVSESFPLPPSPSTVHPDRVVDASVSVLTEWKKQAASAKELEGRAGAVVVKVATVAEVDGLEAHGVPILSAQVPFNLEDPELPTLPTAKFPVGLATTFTKPSEAAVKGLTAALKAGHIVDIDVQVDVADGDKAWEDLEEFLTKATADTAGAGTIVLSNILPPPHDLELPIVKLLSHPTYMSYQAHVASLSLFPNLFLKFLPPTWNAPTPPTPPPGQETAAISKEKKEWKRRIKMYLGPAVEAFGFQRVLFGSSPSPTSHASSTLGDWYEIARESFGELGVEQEDVDAVFGGNASRVYAPRP